MNDEIGEDFNELEDNKNESINYGHLPPLLCKKCNVELGAEEFAKNAMLCPTCYQKKSKTAGILSIVNGVVFIVLFYFDSTFNILFSTYTIFLWLVIGIFNIVSGIMRLVKMGPVYNWKKRYAKLQDQGYK
ncbi:MAG: hypothetical protein ACTSUE_19015 [Promethearchaeota archaeon]